MFSLSFDWMINISTSYWLSSRSVLYVTDPHQFMAQAWSARAINQRRRTRVRNLQCGPGRWGQKDFYFISTVHGWWVLGRFLCTQNGFKFLMHLERNMNQFEIITMRLVRSKKVLNFYLLTKLRTLDNKSQNILAAKTALNFSGPCSGIQPA